MFHGELDILTHPSQSILFGQELKAHGASVEVTIYPNANHGYYSPGNPVEFKDTTLKLAHLYARNLKQESFDSTNLEARLDESLKRYFPLDTIPPASLTGHWKSKNGSLKFNDDGTGTIASRSGRTCSFTYEMADGPVIVQANDTTTEYFMQNDLKAIYSVVPDGRHAGKKEHYTK